MHQPFVMPLFRVTAGTDAMYFATRDALLASPSGSLVVHFMQPGFLLLVVFLLIEGAELLSHFRKARRGHSSQQSQSAPNTATDGKATAVIASQNRLKIPQNGRPKTTTHKPKKNMPRKARANRPPRV